MNVYREHIAPIESQDDYVARIDRQNRDECWMQHPKSKPPAIEAAPAQTSGLTMSPMGIVFS